MSTLQPPRHPDTNLVITGHNTNGTTTILSKTQPESHPVGDGTHINPLFSSSTFPADISQTIISPPDLDDGNKGSFFTTYDIPPSYTGPQHRSVTIDHVIVTKGRVVLTLGDGARVELKEGDTVVQRGTMHAWSNESGEWARLVSVLMPARPISIGSGEELGAVWPF
ncbi:cupin domain-containing protein [Aspergillus ruber CBS 135680]|uniref:Cupin type-2 domain-containing protein n=1 Tax=Aspergillus ruber (strain CBS 135680) TaxID=1388766 RepID=A0A017SPV4_ASPRC|nr:uncharacterized protein EURHEDRAFT_408050 [Aspergillus ruber CBS 135680]EYE98841.1 hypothetical protein EURHEDRAFT_408050 [Aspergillus ruber CBS 135680]